MPPLPAEVAESVDAADSKSAVEIRKGSSPFLGTKGITRGISTPAGVACSVPYREHLVPKMVLRRYHHVIENIGLDG